MLLFLKQQDVSICCCVDMIPSCFQRNDMKWSTLSCLVSVEALREEMQNLQWHFTCCSPLLHEQGGNVLLEKISVSIHLCGCVCSDRFPSFLKCFQPFQCDHLITDAFSGLLDMWEYISLCMGWFLHTCWLKEAPGGSVVLGAATIHFLTPAPDSLFKRLHFKPTSLKWKNISQYTALLQSVLLKSTHFQWESMVTKWAQWTDDSVMPLCSLVDIKSEVPKTQEESCPVKSTTRSQHVCALFVLSEVHECKSCYFWGILMLNLT